jgi:hypothetical protein
MISEGPLSMKMLGRNGALAVAAFFFSVTSFVVEAKKPLPPPRPTAQELVLLPKACDARLNGDESVRARWEQQIGRQNFLHLHHYCFGLNYINRAKITFDKPLKRYFLQAAGNNFDYVLTHWPADSPLRPDAEDGKRQVEMLMRLL